MSSAQYNSPKSGYSTPPVSPTDSSSSVKLSRARQAQNYLEEHVPQWKDDILIQSLFANLPNREVKPEAFKQKYSFWKDLLISMTRERLLSGSVFKFKPKNLSGSFKRGGLQPICLNGVISEMQSEGIAFDAEGTKRSSIVGGMVSWIYGSLKTIIIGEDSSADLHNDLENELPVPETILLPSLLKEQFDALRNFLSSSHFMPFTFEEFLEVINETRRKEGLAEIVEKDDVLLILKYLSEKKILSYSPSVEKITDEVVLAIKVKGTVSSVDFDIVRMKRLHRKLLGQVDELSDRIRELSDSARKSVLFDKKMALSHLKRKSLLEKVQGDRLNSLHAVEELLLRISSLADEAMIVEAYKSGAKTLKGLLPNVEDVEGAVEDLQEIIADHNEITQALNNFSTPVEFDEELEAELKALTESVAPPKSPLATDMETLTSDLNRLKTGEEIIEKDSTETVATTRKKLEAA